jgi:nuclease S1
MPHDRLRAPWRPVLVLGLTFLVAFQATPAFAWGRPGHRVIAKLAERHLTPQAKAAIAELLESGESLADCSTWADEHRRELPKTAPWHYVDAPLDEPRHDDRFAAGDPKKGFIVPKIRELRVTLKDRSRPIQERRQALRFLVHLVEDLHQPLHVGENHDRGGNDTQVRWFTRGSNMHRVWDTGIIDHAARGENGWLDDLIAMDTPESRQKAQAGSVEDWATESLLAARQAYQYSAAGKRMKPGAKLADSYQVAIIAVL